MGAVCRIDINRNRLVPLGVERCRKVKIRRGGESREKGHAIQHAWTELGVVPRQIRQSGAPSLGRLQNPRRPHAQCDFGPRSEVVADRLIRWHRVERLSRHW